MTQSCIPLGSISSCVLVGIICIEGNTYRQTCIKTQGRKVCMEKGGDSSNLEPSLSRIGSKGDYYRHNAAQWALRRLSVAG